MATQDSLTALRIQEVIWWQRLWYREIINNGKCMFRIAIKGRKKGLVNKIGLGDATSQHRVKIP